MYEIHLQIQMDCQELIEYEDYDMIEPFRIYRMLGSVRVSLGPVVVKLGKFETASKMATTYLHITFQSTCVGK
jgi:hypothetical protein